MGISLEQAIRDEGYGGDVRSDRLHQLLYAQDASAYVERPTAVAFPRTTAEVQDLVRVANGARLPLIPRAAGTSLAGQCVGAGIVVDTGRHMNQILELNAEERWVRVQPGVILDDLNRFLAPHGLFFGPDTSTANRCMIGGMVGNNSCGAHSILYGNTMRHVLELEAVFSDGECARLGAWTPQEVDEAAKREDRLGAGVRALLEVVDGNKEQIEQAYPPRDVVRRNSGYPLDDVAARAPFGNDGPFNLARFLCGTEGTLAFTTEIKLALVPKPRARIMVVAHFADLMEALRATVVAVGHDPAAVELIDRRILEQTKSNIEQQRNRAFIEGDPDAVLVIEFYRETDEELEAAASGVIAALQAAKTGYAFPIVRPPDDKRVWALRKAGLGILMGVPGDVKAVSVVEDTAVQVPRLPEYVADVMEIMARHDTRSVYHAHASVGELHIRPELNLKSPDDVRKFEEIGREVAQLVRRYNGSLSGEHGDGRVRSPFLEEFFGADVYALHRTVKEAFDPHDLLNPKNIVDPRPIDEGLRFEPGAATPEIATQFDWSSDLGFMRAVEKCNGAGACRKRAESGGTMCPSYMATLDEKDSTRGRANVFRQLLLEDPAKAMQDPVVYDAMSLCLSCKACKSECPANVDMARLKAEFLQSYWDRHGTPLSARLFAYYGAAARLASIAPRLANFLMSLGLTRWLMSVLFGVTPERRLPPFAARPFRKWWKSRPPSAVPGDAPTVWLYVDPFTEYTEPEIAQAAVAVLEAAGRRVELFEVRDDGRTLLSKGFVRACKELVNRECAAIRSALDHHPDRVVVGLEPSSLLTFRDEWPDLAEGESRVAAKDLASRALLLDEYLAGEISKGRVEVEWAGSGDVVLHGHCHQKSLSGTGATKAVLEAAGYAVRELPTGCCGMAGSFGYERDHYQVSMAVGELVLFPELRAAEGALVAAPGTSCRHQIADGVGREGHHPAVLLADAIKGS